MRSEIQKLGIKIEDINEKLEELYKVHNEKKAILNIPVNLDLGKNGKGANGKPFDAGLVVDALEKMRDYITSENKKIREDFFKLHLDIESKIKDKLDKSDVEALESNLNLFQLYLERLNEQMDLMINERTKKFVDKADLKKIKAQIDK